MPTRDFWSKQRVFLTGHTGFKGSWMARWLSRMGAVQTGYARAPETDPALFPQLEIPRLTSVIGDICDPAPLAAAVKACDPTIGIHMAAQPLVRRSYREPAETYASNVMGTLNVLDSLRLHGPNLKAVLVVTTDKVYRNDDSGQAFKENDALGGHDPYSSSKAACEEVVSCYRQSYYEEAGVPLVSARAGNVVGGGDWSEDRLVPDIWRAMVRGDPVVLRNPASVRPWQHVLDPVSGYLDYIEAAASGKFADMPRALNFAPAADSPMTVQEVTEALGSAMDLDKPWELAEGAQPVEMKLLTLDATLATKSIGWEPQLTGRQAVEWTAEWIRQTRGNVSAQEAVDAQIDQYEALLRA